MRVLVAVAILLSTWACSSSQNGQPGNPPQAKTPEEAISMLSNSDRAAFDAWKGKLEKTCDASEIFNGTTQDTRSLDARNLLAATGQTLLIAGPQGKLAILEPSDFPAGTEDTDVDRSGSASGQSSYQLAAKSHRNGSDCEISLFGQVVFSTSLIQSVSVVAAFDPSAASQAYSATMQFNPASNDRAAELKQLGFELALRDALKPTENTRKWLAAQIGTQPEFFPLGNGLSQGLISVDELNSTTPIAFGEDSLLGSKADLTSILAGPGRWHLTVLIPPVLANFSKDVANTRDQGGLWTLNAEVSVVQSTTAAASYQYSVTAVQTRSETPLRDADAISCFLKRLSLLKSLDAPFASTLMPLYDRVLGGCALLTDDFESAFVGSSDAIAALDERFAGIQGSDTFNYGGWDEAVLTLVRRVIASGKDVRQTLDPASSSPVIDEIAANETSIVQTISAHSELRPVSDALQNMAAEWAFHGKVVAPSRLSSILTAAEVAATPFSNSTSQMIADLAKDPESASSLAETQFVLAHIDAAYVSAASALEASAGALGSDGTDFVSTRINNVIQQQTSADQLRAWTGELNAAGAFAARDRARKSSDETFFDENLESVLKRALEEGWTAQTFGVMEAIAPLEKYSTFCIGNPTSVSGLASCGTNFRTFSTESGQMLDAKFGDRYARASAEFQSAMQRLAAQDFWSDRDSLQTAFWGPLWDSCGNPAFTSKLQTLHGLVDQLARTQGDISDQIQLENALRDALRDCSN